VETGHSGMQKVTGMSMLSCSFRWPRPSKRSHRRCSTNYSPECWVPIGLSFAVPKLWRRELQMPGLWGW
jgi:hypothetical protein